MLLQLEIITFFAFFIYIVYYFSDIILSIYKKKKNETLDRIQRQKIRKNQIKSEEKLNTLNINSKVKEIHKEVLVSDKHGEQIREISKRAQINISRGYYDSARSLIIEGLALKKHDKDLNLLLADVYERERKYQNAEFIYRDLLDEYEDDDYLLQRLGNIYVLRGKISKSIGCYEQALKFDRNNTEILDILAHLHLENIDYKKSLKYTNLYLKEKPRNAEKLSIKGYCNEKLANKLEAIKAYEDVLKIQPYNTEISDRIKVIESR